MGILDAIFGKGKNTLRIEEMLAKGAVVIDVRTPGEFSQGHVSGSLNYPLQSISGKIQEIEKMGKPVVLCCASGNRSGQACRILQAKGIDCENGGSWGKVQRMM